MAHSKDDNRQKYDRQKAEATAMELWRNLGEDYRTKVIRYRFLISTKRLLKIQPLHLVSERDIKNYPNIPFLKIFDEDEARIFLEGLQDYRLDALIAYIQYVVKFDFSYNTLTARICDYEWEIRHHGDKKSAYGIDPGKYCCAIGKVYNSDGTSSGGRYRSHHPRD